MARNSAEIDASSAVERTVDEFRRLGVRDDDLPFIAAAWRELLIELDKAMQWDNGDGVPTE